MSNRTIDQFRVLMAPGNPLPGTAEPGAAGTVTGLPGADSTLDWIMSPPEQTGRPLTPGRPPRLNWPARRVVAPLGASLAVAGLIAGLTFAAQSPRPHIHRPATGAPTADAAGSPMPGFFVQYGVNPDNYGLFATVYDSKTGQVLSQIAVPGFARTVPIIAADGSDRTFLLTATLGPRPTIVRGNGSIARKGRNGSTAAFFRLQVAPDGRSEKLTRLAMNLLPAGSNDVVEGMAVAPGGRELAVAVDIANADPNSLNTRGEIALYSLTGGPTRTWTASADVRALPSDPVWMSTTKLAFVWQDKLRGSGEYFFTGRSQIRVLDTSAHGNSLLASSVLLSGGGKPGFIQSGYAGPSGSPINVATFRVSSIGGSGEATMLLGQVSPAGSVTKTFETYTKAYNGLEQEGAVSSICQVLATDATGEHTLAACPKFGRIDNGTFTSLEHNSGDWMVAW